MSTGGDEVDTENYFKNVFEDVKLFLPAAEEAYEILELFLLAFSLLKINLHLPPSSHSLYSTYVYLSISTYLYLSHPAYVYLPANIYLSMSTSQHIPPYLYLSLYISKLSP